MPLSPKILTAIAAVPCGIWAYLLLGRSGFWRIAPHLPRERRGANDHHGVTVAAVIAARNEAGVIGRAVTSLLAQEFKGSLHVFVVDDSSTDNTADEARSAAEVTGQSDALTVLRAAPLAPGWTGKLWAASQGVSRAEQLKPDFLLLTDADIEHAPTSLATLISLARSDGYDLVSTMVKLETASFAERALIPAFVFFFFMLYPPALIRSRRSNVAGAAGGCILIRPERLRAAGGLESIRGEIIDDCALARITKEAGGKLWLGLTAESRSIRSYGSFAEINRMIARTAFNQLRHSAVLLAGTLLGLAVTYVVPVVFALLGKGTARILGFTAWGMMTFAYLPMVRFYAVNPAWSLALPAIAAFYSSATVRSALNFWSGHGGNWKGRAQDQKRETHRRQIAGTGESGVT